MNDSQLDVARNLSALRERLTRWRRDGLTIAFAPTMGALHAGHLSLIETGRRLADRTVASIFVNPKQFAPTEDFSTYPRTESADLAALASAGCDLVYLPPPEDIYPPGFCTHVRVEGLTAGLCGEARPHFFGGVATVVAKLLNQVRPDVAVFGEKDYQQLLVVRRMAHDLDLGVEIVGAPIVREADGLAMSSRNAYLSESERAVAGRLNGVLAGAASSIVAGYPIDAALNGARSALLEAGFDRVDYVEARAAADLAGPPFPSPRPALRILAAAVVGRTRLIDNWPVDAEPPEPDAR